MNRREKQITAGILLALTFLIGLGIAGTGDIEAEQDSARMYTEMVCKGHWPDYEGRKPKC